MRGRLEVVHADVLLQDFRRNLDFELLVVGRLADQMAAVALVLGANIFEQFRIGFVFQPHGDHPLLRQGFRIVQCFFDFQMSEIGPPESLRNAQVFGVRMAIVVQPASVVVARQ